MLLKLSVVVKIDRGTPLASVPSNTVTYLLLVLVLCMMHEIEHRHRQMVSSSQTNRLERRTHSLPGFSEDCSARFSEISFWVRPSVNHRWMSRVRCPSRFLRTAVGCRCSCLCAFESQNLSCSRKRLLVAATAMMFSCGCHAVCRIFLLKSRQSTKISSRLRFPAVDTLKKRNAPSSLTNPFHLILHLLINLWATWYIQGGASTRIARLGVLI